MQFCNFLAVNATNAHKRKSAMLPFLAGPRIRDVFRQLPDTRSDDDYEAAFVKDNEYFEPQKNRAKNRKEKNREKNESHC